MASSFFFNIAETRKADALWFESYFGLSFLSRLRKITQWVVAGFIFLFLFTFIPGDLVSENTSRFLLGLVFLLFAYNAAIFVLERFADYLKTRRPALSSDNTAEQLSFSSAKAAHEAQRLTKRNRLLHIGSLSLLAALIKQDGVSEFIFHRLLLDKKEFQESLKNEIKGQTRRPAGGEASYAPDFQKTIEAAVNRANQAGRIEAEPEDLLAALASHNEFFKSYLVDKGFLPERDIPRVAQWHYSLRRDITRTKKFWLKDNLRKHGSLGKDWAAGYTITLDEFSIDISKKVLRENFPRAVDHEQEKESLQRILSRQQVNNALLVGNPGSGRRRLIEDFASKSVLGQHENPALNYQRVVELDVSHLLAGIQSMEEAEAALSQILQEATASGNLVLVIDEFHNFVGEGLEAAPGRANVAGVLTNYLRNPNFPFIAVTTYAGLHRYLQRNPSLLSFFDQVEVSELSQEETLSVLQEIAPAFENRYKKFIPYPALQSIITYADKYIQATPFPKKATDLLDETMGYLAQTPEQVLLPKHVAAIVSERTQIPVGDIESTERETLLDLEELIHKRIINQEEAVREVASALRRARTEVASRNGPMGSFLFLGPTGVGKTETAKALAAIYFGSERRIIRLDMSEFQNVQDTSRLLGTATQDGLLTTAVREDPFSLLLLDELEKAHPNILNLFLQVLDEGNITDGLGRKTDFRHTIIIATSNAGYQLILRAVKEGKDFAKLKEEMLEYIFEQGLYRPEFLNRFDGVILFTPLSQEHLLQIAGLMLGRIQKNLKEKGIELKITEPLKAKIAELGYDPRFGARNMRRVLQDKVENALAVALLNNNIKRGDRAAIDPDTFQVRKI